VWYIDPSLCLSFLETMGQKNPKANVEQRCEADCPELGTAQCRAVPNLVPLHKTPGTGAPSSPCACHLLLVAFSSLVLRSTKEFAKYFVVVFKCGRVK